MHLCAAETHLAIYFFGIATGLAPVMLPWIFDFAIGRNHDTGQVIKPRKEWKE